jgi:SAM-dependent methyltransferase
VLIASGNLQKNTHLPIFPGTPFKIKSYIVPTLWRGNATGDAPASCIAGALLDEFPRESLGTMHFEFATLALGITQDLGVEKEKFMGSYRNTYEVLIASPSDLSEERSKIVKAICEWNFENSRRSIAFSPLLWEWNAIPDADKAAQQAINEQLLSRADFVIAAFKGRMGTPTEDGFQAGTIEELSKRKGRAAVFFPKKWPLLDPNDPRYDELYDQVKALREFKKTVSGFTLEYENSDDLLNKVKQTLTNWAQMDDQETYPILSLVHETWNPKQLLRQTVPLEKKAYVLLFNTELKTLKTKEDFEKNWSFLREMPWVEKVILLLSSFKVDRLRKYLVDSTAVADPELLGRFSVSPQREPTKSGPLSISSSLSFALLRYGTDPCHGTCAPISQLAVLAEPFASAQLSECGGPDLEWDYKYFFEFSEPQLQEKLEEIWDHWFQSESLIEVSALASERKDKSEVNHFLERQKDYQTPAKIDEEINLISDLKHRLFDPNVPSYLMNDKFELLDWNTAFELVFPTTRFYRHESVMEFVDCLANKDAVKRRGAELIAGSPLFDMEELTYCSPNYGAMRFTKIASKVNTLKSDKSTGQSNKSTGWIVALNVNQVEHWGEYEQDLRLMNERQALLSELAPCSNRILSQFPGYLELAKLHATALGSCLKILDLGCGPGILSAELLKSPKQRLVTAIDQNDTMLDMARKRCENLPGFSAVKANLETLHRPHPRYSFMKVGIRENYDGAAMFNNYYWLSDPASFLRRLANEGLLAPDGILTISMLTGEQDVNDLLCSIQQFHLNQEQGQDEDFRLWSDDFDSFSSSLYKLLDPKGNTSRVIGRYEEEDVASDLVNAGYKIIAKARPIFTVEGRDFSPYAFFVAKRIL